MRAARGLSGQPTCDRLLTIRKRLGLRHEVGTAQALAHGVWCGLRAPGPGAETLALSGHGCGATERSEALANWLQSLGVS